MTCRRKLLHVIKVDCAGNNIPYYLAPNAVPANAKDAEPTMMRTKACAIIMLVTMAGCAGPMGPLQPGTPPAPAVTAYDGSYQTTIRSTNTSRAALGSSWCDTPPQIVATVANGNLTYSVPHPNVPGNPTPSFQATFAADGSFSGQVNDGTVTGRVTGGQMEGRIDGAACNYAFSGQRM